MQPYNDEMLEKITDEIDTYSANYGGTEILEPIQSATELDSMDYKTPIFLLTVGDVDDPDRVIGHIKTSCKEENDETRVFTFGIGQGCDKYLVKESAKAGKGKHYFVMEKEMDQLKRKIIDSLQCASEPALNGCSF